MANPLPIPNPGLPPINMTDQQGNLTPAGMVWFQQQSSIQHSGQAGAAPQQTAHSAYIAIQNALKQKVK